MNDESDMNEGRKRERERERERERIAKERNPGKRINMDFSMLRCS